MRLRTYEATEAAGAAPQLGMERNGRIVPLHGVSDVAAFFSLPAETRTRLARDAETALAKDLGAPAASVKTLLPVLDPRKVICVGLNYRDHAAEQNLEIPKAPALFPKYASSLVAHGEPIELPRESAKVDYEAELVLVIGSRADHVSLDDAWSVVGGLTIGNDVSVRDYQGATTQWMNGKIFDRTTPVGPVVVTPDEFPDPADLEIWLEIGGEVLQRSRTSQFVFDVPQMIEYVTRMTTLEPGDLIFTGTPGGVGFLRKPRRYLQDGETVTVYVEGIGTLVNPVKAPEGGAAPDLLPKPRREERTA
ncbi:MAG TPA: fumarylacetoacetate hydrolase family protein [Candidatus Dormibacteraeota bacterium]|nr:fumarylacetoacetate hydrolase family protein [Candidatus Dormibacteraeota bacterium]